MLRHLGAAYYESLHGRATRADVTRALDNIAEQLNELAAESGHPAGAQHPAPQHGDGQDAPRLHGWARRVGDVMRTAVITVDRQTSYKEIVGLLAANQISGVPVLKMGREVVGVVTEADLIAAQRRTTNRLRAAARQPWWRPWSSSGQHPSLTAGELMTTPAITIGPQATVPAAARLMSMHQLGRLPVVDDEGKLLGIVGRRDLLTVFLRPDEDIAADIRRVLDDIVLSGSISGPGEADVAVRNGIVTLTGTLNSKVGPHGDLLPLAIRLMWDVDGVVDIIDELGEPVRTPA
jgi:CBS domain-containing protein